MTRFLLCSDLQMGAHPGYGRSPGDRLADMEAVWEQVLGVAVDQDVDAVLIGGDAFDHRRPTPAELMAFQRPLLAFLAEHDVPVLAINGNHDVESADLPSSLELFEPVIDVHTEPGVWIPGAPGEVAVCTLPWVPMSRLRARLNGGDGDDVNAMAARLLVEIARGLRAQVDGPAILLGHWHADSALAMSGKDVSEIFREPLLCMADLEAIGFDAIALGHNHLAQGLGSAVELHPLHEREVHITTGSAHAFHIGSPQPVDFSEARSPHGVWVLDLDGPLVSRFVPIESRPFITIDADLVGRNLPVDPQTAIVEVIDAEEIARDGGLDEAVVKLRYRASEEDARRVDHPTITRALYEAGAHKVFQIEAQVERAARARVDGVTEDLSPLAAFDLYAAANELDPELAGRARARLAEHLEAVGS